MSISNTEMHKSVSRLLENSHIIISPENEWFKQCVDFFMSDNPNYNANDLSSMVTEQLSLSDFQEIALSSLPPNLNNFEKKILSGKYCLQVNTILDVGQSCYSQYNVLVKRDTSNTEIGDSKPAPWEPKSRRMLKMMCTDGKQTVMAMEYEPLSCLKEPFISGFKIGVTGPVEYRKGVLLLKSNNVHFIGGEVEHLLIKNAPLNVLCRALNKPELENPYMFSNIEVDKNAMEVQESHTINPRRQIDGPQMNEMTQNSVNQTNNSNSVKNGVITFDDFFDGDDDELLYLTQVVEIEKRFSQSNNKMNSVPSATINTQNSTKAYNPKLSILKNNKITNKKLISTIKQTKISDMLGSSTSAASSSSVTESTRPINMFDMFGPSTSSSSNNLLARSTKCQADESIENNCMAMKQSSGKRVASSPIQAKTKRPSIEIHIPEEDWDLSTMNVDIDISDPLVKVFKSASIVKNSKIQVKQNEWICSGIIKEETKTEEVEFSSKVLEHLIGISSEEVLQFKNNPLNNASLKEKIEKGIKGAYRKLHLFKVSVDSKKKKKSGYEFRVAKKMKAFQMSANSSQKITHFYTNNVVGESSQTSLENPKPDERDQINKNQNEKLELAELEKIHEITTKVKVKESNIDFLKYKNQDAEINENSKEVLVETIEIRQEYHQDITGEIVQKLFANEKIDEVINYFCKPKSIDIVNFFIFHPIQPTNSSLISLPFNEKIFFSDQGDCKFNRKWLTYDENNQKLFCSVCLAYSDESSKFCSGFNDWKHTSQRIKEHEISKHHNSSVKAYIREKREKTVQHLLCGEQLQKRKIEVNERRCVLLQIIEVIKLIGKQGLPFRGDKSEAAYKLDDSSLNHGNFLEIILLLSKSENILKSHIEKSIKLSKEHHDRAQNINMKALKTTTKIGRGNLVTFLSATTVTTIIKLIGKEIKNMISREVKKAKIFSVMMDTTMDLSSYDQCSIVLRYVPHNEVCERLIGLKHVTSTSGNSLFETLKDTLAELDLPLNNCVANAFDGAANMSGHYNGVTAKLSEVITNHVHTWCYAHVLNLVLSDTTQCLTPCMSFFNLVQEAFVFFKESYKRLAVYHKENPSLKLAASVATRWRSRNDAIVKIFGRIDFWIKGDLSPENESKFAYIQLLVALYEISISNQFNSKIRNDSLSLMKKFCSYETVLVAMMFLQIFKIITPLSDYLQTKHLDYIQAWRHVSSAHKSLQSVRNRFCDITKAAKTFVDFVVKKIDEKELLRDIEIEENLPKKRKRTVKRMDGELTRDEEVSTEEIDQFCIKIFNFTMDTIINSLEGTILSSSDFIYRFRMFRPSKV
ncbi:uncharacterized protein LOC112687804 isoform X2 [Sipha flava]|nr:uncharacterized protein LOC112687804 isoform X2 [Sipha flava]XP_025416539.1 uncharacterized protein LOC112687804 isoform X2 [Sipha flava]XP_025416540.1 uncharacterized protein LOC112687804 isoform X2 [Sipha flava]